MKIHSGGQPTMSRKEMADDYLRLKLEYTRLHEDYRRLQGEKDKQLRIGGVMPSVYVVTCNDDYGRPIFDNCFNDLNIAKEYIDEHDYLRMDETTTIKEIDFE